MAETAQADMLTRIEAAFPGKVLERHAEHGDTTVVLDRGDAAVVLAKLKSHPDFDFAMLTDLTGVDFFGREPRFEVVYHLYSLRHNHRLRVKVPLTEDAAELPSAAGVWKAADWLEREVWDMFGIRFTGHPDLRRILMYEEFRGHPLRKDYPVNKRQPLVEERDPLSRPWQKA